MSLINDALKKAQKMRAAHPEPPSPPAAGEPNAAPTSPAPTTAAPASALPEVAAATSTSLPPARRFAKRRRPVSAKAVVLGVGTGALALLVVGGVALYVLLPDSAPPELVHRDQRPVRAVADESEAMVEPTPVIVPPNLTGTDGADPAGPANSSSSAAPGSPPSGNPPSNLARASGETTAPDAAERIAPTPDPRVLAFLDAARVNGIRASATDPKVLMNDRLFRIGDVIEPAFGLRLTAVTANQLTFIDSAGVEYRKRFY